MFKDVNGNSTNDEIKLTNVGGEFMLNAKVVDSKKVKWRIGGNLSYNISVTSDRHEYNKTLKKEPDNYYVIGDKPLTYNVYRSVYDENGNLVDGFFVDRSGNDYVIQVDDREVSDFSQVPTFVGGINTYFEAVGAYLQIDSHASLDRFNIIGKTDPKTNWPRNSLYGTADIHNASFLRIDNIVLGYKFKNIWKLSGRAYAAVQNPYVFTKYTGDEPEIYEGFDYGFTYARPTIFSVGVKLNVNIKD